MALRLRVRLKGNFEGLPPLGALAVKALLCLCGLVAQIITDAAIQADADTVSFHANGQLS